jgi:hypothetical protein
MYINRTMTPEGRDKLVHQLEERCNLIETAEEPYGPLVFHAEGAVTNGTVLSEFKRGAFVTLKTVQPMFIEYDYHVYSPSYECINGFELWIFSCASSLFKTQRVRLHVFPDFTPNEQMWKTHKQNFKENWEIYAWAMHDFLQTRFDLPDNP